MYYFHHFTSTTEYEDSRVNNYGEPWVSLTEDTTDGDYMRYDMTEEEKEEKLVQMPLTFEILSDGNINWKSNQGSSSYWKTLEYSKNGGEWTTFRSSYNGTTLTVKKGDRVAFRGDNAGLSNGNTSRYNYFGTSTAKFKIYGNIMSLLYKENFATATTISQTYAFNRLFYNCTGLTDVSELLLPATTLANNCYQYMFEYCRSLTTPPELPATTLADSCYQYMFDGCTSLVKGLSSIGTSATTMAASACTNMFRDCSSLTTAPELPATTLADGCYYNMFNGCTSLTKAPSILPATILTSYSYYNMFAGCTALTTAPLSIGTTETVMPASACTKMFYNCKSLETIPDLPAETTNIYCYYGMFSACTGLIDVSSSTIGSTNATMATFACLQMFGGCTNLVYGPEILVNTLSNKCFMQMFDGCTSLVKGPSSIGTSTTTMAASACTEMFDGCTSLTQAPELPVTTLAPHCYSNMFRGCTSLTIAPELPDVTMANYCCSNMFNGCINLSYIKCLVFTSRTLPSSFTNSWVGGVASAGTFVIEPKTNAWTIGNNGIPTNWTVVSDGFNVNTNCLYINKSESSYTITIDTTSSWSAECDDTWVHLSQNNGESGLTTINVNIDSTTVTRKGTIKFYYDNKVKNINVAQIFNLDEPLTFEVLSNGYISWYQLNSAYTATLRYKLNNGEWTSITPTTGNGTRINVTSGDTIQFKTPEGITYEYMYKSNYPTTEINCFKMSSKVNVRGNILSILDGDNFPTKTSITSSCFQQFFKNCSTIVSIEDLVLPATTISSMVYYSMFENCTGLTTAPLILPAETEYRCYSHMFTNCTSLTTAPILPSTVSENECYKEMFNGCRSLTQAPELPATILGSDCYYSMFSGCTSLTTAPELPATRFSGTSCYSQMFSNCTSLTQAPDLPAINVNSSCYSYMFTNCISLSILPKMKCQKIRQWGCSNMFENCRSITTVPDDYTFLYTITGDGIFSYMFAGTSITEVLPIPSDKLANGCYYGFYCNCTGITSVPNDYLSSTEITSDCYYEMFRGCTSLTTLPELPATTLAYDCYCGMFQNCTGITTIPSNYLPATTLATGCYERMFDGCTGLITAPELPATNLSGASSCYQYMFQGCTNLTTAPTLPATTLASSCYNYMFNGCTSLTTAPELPATNLSGANNCYQYMFQGCSGLTSAPALPATTLANSCYQGMFSNCTSLTTAPELPATTLASSCYMYMFAGCSGLTTAPTLPATTLVSYCYYGMFANCNNLNYIKCLATDISASKCTVNWVNGVAASGTFVKDPSTSWATGQHGIPTGWTVIDAS